MKIIPMDKDNRMLRAGFGRNKGTSFFRIDLWWMGFRWGGNIEVRKEDVSLRGNNEFVNAQFTNFIEPAEAVIEVSISSKVRQVGKERLFHKIKEALIAQGYTNVHGDPICSRGGPGPDELAGEALPLEKKFWLGVNIQLKEEV